MTAPRLAGALGLTLVAVLSASSGAAGLQPQAGVAPAQARFNSSRAYEDLRQMVAFGPRPAGSPALKQTRAYITSQLAAIGLKVEEQRFTGQTPNGPIEMINLIARLPGRRPERLLLTGHYDTKLLKDSLFVGASDGASSAAILIELARVLKDRPRDLTYEFVWFDGEEATCRAWDECSRPGHPDNLYGSRYYVATAQKAGTLGSIKAMVLFDMIGARDLRLQRETHYSAAWLNQIVWATAKRLGFGRTFLDVDTQIEDDHQPFSEAGVDTIDLIDLNDYPWWHNQVCCDDLSRVAAGSLQIVGDTILAAIPDIEKHGKS